METNIKKLRTGGEIIINEATRMGLTVKILSKESSFYYIEDKKKRLYFKGSDCGLNSSIGLKISKFKDSTNILCNLNGINIPKTKVLGGEMTFKDIIENIKELKYPLVTKPVDGSYGKGVRLNISTKNELKDAISHSKNFSSNGIMIQEQIDGNDYRILVVGNEVVAGTMRVPPYLVSVS